MYRTVPSGWLKHWDFMLLDIIYLEISLIAAYFIRFRGIGLFDDPEYVRINILAILLDIVLIFFMSEFRDVLKRGYGIELKKTLIHAILLFLLLMAYMFLMKEGATYSRITIVVMALIYFAISYLGRVLLKKSIIKRKTGKGASRLLVMTDAANARDHICHIRKNNYSNYEIVGIVYTDGHTDEICGIPAVACMDKLTEYVTRNWIDEIIVCAEDTDRYKNLLNELVECGITVHISLEKDSESSGFKQVVENVCGYSVITSSMNYMSLRQAFIKRAIDIVGGIIGTVITGILYVIVAPMIKKASPGPAIFTQTRIGKNGKPFKMYKFRSMYLDAEERKAELMKENRIKDGMMFKMEFDPRIIGNRIDENGNQITGIGEFIRKYSIDEFPQFLCVLKGTMSLVGTRPPTTDEFAKYEAHHRARLAAKPGITGLWQVSGRSNILDFEEVVRLDTQYINNWSVSMDLKILLKTLKVVLKKEGSM